MTRQVCMGFHCLPAEQQATQQALVLSWTREGCQALPAEAGQSFCTGIYTSASVLVASVLDTKVVQQQGRGYSYQFFLSFSFFLLMCFLLHCYRSPFLFTDPGRPGPSSFYQGPPLVSHRSPTLAPTFPFPVIRNCCKLFAHCTHMLHYN